jgi:hypothetical protein
MYSLCHDISDIVGIQLGVIFLLLTWIVDRKEFNLTCTVESSQGQPEKLQTRNEKNIKRCFNVGKYIKNLRSRTLPGPSYCVQLVGVTNTNGLDGHPRVKGA